jgi:carbonic anhydrase
VKLVYNAWRFIITPNSKADALSTETTSKTIDPVSIVKDLSAGLVVFLVALPLCLGIALASGAPLFSGIVAGIVGGLVVGVISGSHTSVSGPAAGLTAIVSMQIVKLSAFETFLLAVVLAGVFQIILGILKAGALSTFFPSSVIKGLLAAIGVILILKQIPHLLGHDSDPEGEMAFEQPDHENTFSEIIRTFWGEIHYGALTVGIISLILVIAWDKIKPLKNSLIPGPLVVVVVGTLIGLFLRRFGGEWLIGNTHLVQVPVANNWQEFTGFLDHPDFSKWMVPAVYSSAAVIALVASLETLLNLEAIDKIDPQQRRSPPNRELIAQGCGNIVSGLIGGIPVTSVIIRSSVNINAGARTKLSTIVHGFILLLCVVLMPKLLNLIPISCLAAILLATGIKLASPALFKQMWSEGRYQFIPFIVTLVAIVLTDLIIGIGIGLAFSVAFILNSNIRRPVKQVVQQHASGEVRHIRLANQVSFLNRAALEDALYQARSGTHLLIDAEATDYIDPDILSLIRDYKQNASSVHNVQVSTKGFKPKFNIPDDIQFQDYTTLQLQQKFSPADVLDFLKAGNERFHTGNRIERDLGRQMHGTAGGQHPLAVVLTCIDSRSPAELIFDLGIGDIFTIRIAGNVIREKVLGSMEYACAVAGAKLILVMGHTRCGAVNASVDLACCGKSTEEATGCQHLDLIVQEISKSIDINQCSTVMRMSAEAKATYCDEVARRNVMHAVDLIRNESSTIQRLLAKRSVALVGAMYDISSGKVEFLNSVERESTVAP